MAFIKCSHILLLATFMFSVHPLTICCLLVYLLFYIYSTNPPPPADCMHHFHSFMISRASQPGPTLHLLLLLPSLVMCIYVRCLLWCSPFPCFMSLSASNISCILFQTSFPYLPFSSMHWLLYRYAIAVFYFQKISFLSCNQFFGMPYICHLFKVCTAHCVSSLLLWHAVSYLRFSKQCW
jgi:hypothetical protein